MAERLLYFTPPVFGEQDERRMQGGYGLLYFAVSYDTVKKQCLYDIVHYLLPREAGMVIQTRKIFFVVVEAAAEQLVRHLHYRHFAHVPYRAPPLPSPSSFASSFARYLHELSSREIKKVLLMGGFNAGAGTSVVDAMVIRTTSSSSTPRQAQAEEPLAVSWQACDPMVKSCAMHAAVYYKGQVISVHVDGRVEKYHVHSQIAGNVVDLQCKLPFASLNGFAMAELNGKAFVVGGCGIESSEGGGEESESNRVFCLSLDDDIHVGWIEQETRLLTARHDAAAVAYQGKLWIAGGTNYRERISTIEVFDPLVGSWQAAGDLTAARRGNLCLLVIEDELYAAGADEDGVSWVEKRENSSGLWRLIGEFHDDNDESRQDTCIVACDKHIYFLGGGPLNTTYSCLWDAFNIETCRWISQQQIYRDNSTRQLPRRCIAGCAVLVTPSDQQEALSSWSSFIRWYWRDEMQREEALIEISTSRDVQVEEVEVD